MFEIVTSTKFLKDLNLLKKRSVKDFQLLQQLITTLVEKATKESIKSINRTNLVVITKVIGNAM